MNRQQAADVLAVFTKAFPWANFPIDSQQLWSDEMQRLDNVDALRAARQLVETTDRWPTLHQFLDATLAITERRLTEEGKPDGPRPQIDRVRQLEAERDADDPRTPEEMELHGAEDWIPYIRAQLKRRAAEGKTPPHLTGFRTAAEVVVENLARATKDSSHLPGKTPGRSKGKPPRDVT